MEIDSNEPPNFDVSKSNGLNSESSFSGTENSFQTQDSSAQEVPTPYEASAPEFSVPHFDRINYSSPATSSLAKVILGIIVVLIIIGVGSIFAFSSGKNSSNTSPQISTTQILRISTTMTTLPITTVSTTATTIPTTVQSTVANQTTVPPTTSAPQTTQPPPPTTNATLGPPITGPPINSSVTDSVTIDASKGTITAEMSKLPGSLAYVTVNVINASTANFSVNGTGYSATPSLRVTLSSPGYYVFGYGNSSTTIELTGGA